MGSIRDYIVLNSKERKEYYSDNITRFILAQKDTYEIALSEIKQGRKKSHWIWWIFPQMKGLGYSGRSQYYGISDRNEAFAYINNELLKNRLIEVTIEVYNSKYSPYEIFGNDTIKFVSCMKLFASVSDNPIFKKVLNKYCWH